MRYATVAYSAPEGASSVTQPVEFFTVPDTELIFKRCLFLLILLARSGRSDEDIDELYFRALFGIPRPKLPEIGVFVAIHYATNLAWEVRIGIRIASQPC